MPERSGSGYGKELVDPVDRDWDFDLVTRGMEDSIQDRGEGGGEVCIYRFVLERK